MDNPKTFTTETQRHRENHANNRVLLGGLDHNFPLLLRPDIIFDFAFLCVSVSLW